MTAGQQPTVRPIATAAVAKARPHRQLVTPFRVVAIVALLGSAGAILYGARFARDDTQLPILVAGLSVFGLVWLALAVAGCLIVLRAGREDDTRTAFFAALLGGLSALVAAGSLGSAIILGLVWTSAP